MAPLTRAQMKQLAEDALRAVQEWLTAIPREILKKLSPDSLFYVLRPNPLWQLRRFTIGKLGQTNKANLQILNERRRNIISRFETLVGGTFEQVRQDRREKAVQNRTALIEWQLGEGRYPSWRAGAAGPESSRSRELVGAPNIRAVHSVCPQTRVVPSNFRTGDCASCLVSK